jgi:tetratricopeptide (TPR) repeat protein
LTSYLNRLQERLHQAELAHAAEVARTQEAQATAAQERKAKEAAQARVVAERQARRLTLALAGTVLLALTLGGGWLYVKNERDARQAQVAREVNDALNKATALREQAKKANVGSAALFAQAREQVQRARALVENGPADDPLKTQVTRLQTELDEEEKDRRLIVALDDARLAQAVVSDDRRYIGKWDLAVPILREAFRTYGLPVGEGEPGAAADRIRQRPAAVREAIFAALDEWGQVAVAEPHREWLQAVLAAAEPEDAWGRQVRTARGENDPAKRRAALEKPAASADVAKVPAWALTRLAKQLQNVEAHASSAQLLRRAQQQYPADFWVNLDLGHVLATVTPPARDEAVRFLTAAVALRSESPGAYNNLGTALHDKGQMDEAIACYKKAVELDPNIALTHTNLGLTLLEKGQVDEAIASFRKAMELDPKYAAAHANLGVALKDKGQVDEAIVCLKGAIALDPRLAPARTTLAEAERLAAARDKLPAFRSGTYTPSSNAERLGLTEWCQIKKLHQTATRLRAAAFAADSKLADDLNSGQRYSAACHAALAAAGQGEDAAKLGDTEKAHLRRQALDWLHADLSLLTKQLESGEPADRTAAQQALRHWQQDSDLTGLRDAAALAKLPAEERAAYQRLWGDVAALLKTAGQETK